MATSFKEIRKKAIGGLPRGDRARLAHDLISSLDDESIKTEPHEWDLEIRRRVNEIKSGYVRGRPAIQMLAEMRARYS
ncbi:MAG: addiction module protein [Chitinispirillaceae bacterium]|nr:addiction module protein [Chitinispirillaceae bacterium]